MIYIGHKPLTYLYTQPNLNACQDQWLERLVELDLQIIYHPGVQNTSADVLSRYGQSIDRKNAVVAQHSLRDMRSAQLVQTWLNVDVPHIDFKHCCETAKAGLEHGHELVSFPCPKYGSVCCNPVKHAMKLQAQHGCMVCKHRWSKYPLV